MYQDFTVNSFNVIEELKTIELNFSFDVDPDSITGNTIKLISRESRNEESYTYKVEQKKVIIVLDEWPNKNTDYILKVQKLKNVVGDTLLTGINRTIQFKSSITSTVEIISPIDFEEVSSLFIKLKEQSVDDLINSFYVECSTDTGFYNIIASTNIIDNNSGTLKVENNGNLYLRARVQKDSQYGNWSNTISFNLKDIENEIPDIEYEEPLELLNALDIFDGEKIVLEFNKTLDPETINNIILYWGKM